MVRASFDPNSLPSATNVRFVLLAATVTLMGLWYGNEVFRSLRFLNAFNQPLNLAASSRLVVAVWILAIGVYFAHPWYCKLRFTRNFSAPPTDIQDEINAAATRVGLRNITVKVDNNIRNFDAIAYGYPFCRRILIGKGNVLQFRKTPDVFRAKIHHELSHIRNSDVDTGFLALGLLFSAATLIVAVSVYWTSNFIYFSRLYYAGKVATVDEPAYYLLIHGIPLMLTGAVWMAVLWLEHRAFIRAREFMADAESAHYSGIYAITSALNSTGKELRKFDLKAFLQGLAKAHPSAQQRAAAAQTYQKAGAPDVYLFATIGLLFSVLENLNDSIAERYLADRMVSSWECDGSGCLNELVRIFTEDRAYLFVNAVGLFFIDAVIVLSTATLLRGALQGRLNQLTFVNYALFCIKLLLGFSAGHALGQFIDPFYIGSLFASGFAVWTPGDPADLITDAATYSVILLLIALPMYWLAAFLSSGTRKKRVPESLWILFSGLVALAALQIVTGSWLAMELADTFSDPVNQGDRVNLLIGVVGGSLLWTGLAIVSGVIIRGGGSFRSSSTANIYHGELS